MRLVTFLRYLVLGICAALLSGLLTGVAPSPATQVATPPALIAAPDLPTSTPLQLTDAGRSRYQAGQYTEAVTLWQQAAAGFAAKGDALNQAMVLSNVALAYQQLGQMSLAQTAIAKSLQLLGCPTSGLGCSASGKDQSKILAQTLNTLGSLQLSQGQAEPAFATWQEAAKWYQRVNDQAGVIRAQINQAQALRAGGFYRRAEALLRQISQTLEKQTDPAIKASGLIGYGDVLRLIGNPDRPQKENLKEAQTILKKGLELAQQQGAIADIAAAYLSLGNTVRAQISLENGTSTQQRKQQLETALSYYQQAVDQAPNPTIKVQAQLNQLSLLVETKDWQKAQALAPKLLPQLSQLPPSRAKVYAQIGYAKSLIKLASQKLASQTTLAPANPEDSAFSPLTTAAYILAEAIQQSSDWQDWQAQSFALGYLGNVYEIGGKDAEALPLTRQALALAESHKAIDIAYRWEWQTGRLYRNLVKPETADSSSDDMASSPDYKKAIAAYNAAFTTLQSLRRDLAAGNADAQFDFQKQTEEPIYRELVDLLLRPQTPSQENLKQARAVIESLQLAELENFLQEPCVASNSESIDQVVDAANSTTAALFPIILKDRVEVILKLPQQKDLVRKHFTVSEAEVQDTLEDFQVNLQLDDEYETAKQQAQKIYAWLIEPVRDQLEAAKINTLVFVPDSKLRNVPMAALYDGKQFLLDHFATTVALNLALQNPKPLPKQLRVLAASLTEPPSKFATLFGKLDNVNKELDAIIAQPGISTTPIRDENFTTQAFNRKINESSFAIVHLATHGKFSSDPETTFLLTASGIIKVDDLGTLFRTRGLNRTDEIELLVLSACETASGDDRAALGIAGTTVRAGARSAIASLWSVDDQSSVELMKQFYQQLGQGNVSRAEALRRAQVSLKDSEQYRYPRYWAPLILLGNWL